MFRSSSKKQKHYFILGTLGFCSSGSCMNGGACKENVVGSTRHAYCQCPSGYDGPKCENRTYLDSVF
jgi:hypothetical protein